MMSEKRFEEEKIENCEYDYSLLDTYYECRDDKIIEWNKHSSNAEYDNFESITRILNIKERRLESCQKGKLRMSDLINENEQLRHELDSLTGCYCADNKEFKDYWRIGYDD